MSCVLFADIAGSTRMYAEHGDDATRAMLITCLDLMETVVNANRGRVVRRIGDELLCLFGKLDDAAMASIALHSKVAAASSTEAFTAPMRLRIGFEVGPVQESDGALFGATVHTAARMASLAKAGQTLTSAATREKLNAGLRCFTRFFERVILKGQSQEQEIYELLWSIPQTTIINPRKAVRPPPPAARSGCIVLEYGGKSYRIDPAHPRFEIGRDSSCDLSVEGRSVSMLHGRVLFERGRPEFEDVSSNGTVIHREGAAAVTAHRSRVDLLGKGILLLGSGADDGSATVQYRLEA